MITLAPTRNFILIATLVSKKIVNIIESIKAKSAEENLISKETFRQFLSEHGFRVTNQRLAIYDAAVELEDHYTAEEMLEKARAIDASVSRATIYRTLPLLIECSLVKEIDVGKDYKFYHTRRGSSVEKAQVLCLDCEKISEIDAPFLEWYGNTVAQKLGLEVEAQHLQVHARCSRLKNEGKCENHC